MDKQTAPVYINFHLFLGCALCIYNSAEAPVLLQTLWPLDRRVSSLRHPHPAPEDQQALVPQLCVHTEQDDGTGDQGEIQ